MHFYKNHRFYFHDFSFELPNNTCLMCGEEELQSTLQFSPKGEPWHITLYPANDKGGAKQFFYSETEIEAYQQIGELTPVICNGAMGWKLVFKSKRHQCAEYHFDIKGDEKSNVFIIRIEASAKDKDISDILRHEAVTELLSSIKTE